MDMDLGAKLWIRKTCKANHWRVSRWIGLDDLVQDGYMWYFATVARYGYRPRTRAHIMALFKRTFINYLHDLSNYKKKLIDVETAISMTIADEAGIERTIEVSDEGASADEITLLAALTTAPEPVQRLLSFAATDAGAKALRESPYRFCKCGCRARETTNQRLGRLIGRSGTFDYQKAVTRFLAGHSSPDLAVTMVCDELDYAAVEAGCPNILARKRGMTQT